MTTLLTHLEQLGIDHTRWPERMLQACLEVLHD